MSDYENLIRKCSDCREGSIELSRVYSLFWEKTVFLKPAERQGLLHELATLSHSHPLGAAWHLFTQAECHVFAAEYPIAIEKASESLQLFNQFNEEGGILAANLMLSLAYRSIGKLDKAQDHAQAAIAIASRIEPQTIYEYFRPITYYQVSELQMLMKKYDEAIKYLTTGIGIAGGNPETKGRMYTGMGNAYMLTSQWQKSEDNFHKALEVINDTRNFVLRSKIYADLGNLYFKKGEIAQALENQQKSLSIRLENNLHNPAIANYIRLAELYDLQKNWEKAIEYGNLALAQAEKTNVLIRLYEAHEVLARIYEHTGDTQKAYEHFKKYHQHREEVFDQEVVSKIEQVNTQHRVELVGQEKEIFRLRNIELKQALDEITESVKYAKRIQKAILPPQYLFKQYFPESFILYKPKDIVAGDFYWMDVINGIPCVAVCDCTGHGVPGALVSVVCHNALTRSLREFAETNPGRILDKTRQLVIDQFEKGDKEVKDGMDCVFCSIDTKNMQLSYAAANNCFYIARGGQLIECPADKMPVGKFTESPNPFKSHTVMLQKGDVIFTLTDGYADQFGGPKGKKFGFKRFEELLLSIAQLPAARQQETLARTLEEWKGKEAQVDDILVIGITI